MEILFVLAVVVLILGGGVCGIIAVSSLQNLKKRLDRLEREVGPLLLRNNQEQIRATSNFEGQITQPIKAQEPIREPGPMGSAALTPLPPSEQPRPLVEPLPVASATAAPERPIHATRTLKDP